MNMDPALMLRAGPGTLARWVRWVITIACVITVVAVVVGGRLVVNELAWYEREGDLFWMRDGAGWLATAAIFFAWVPESKLSRHVRMAVLLPLVHAGLIAFAWYIWKAWLPRLADTSDGRAFASYFPLVTVWLTASAVFAGIAIAGARKGEWAHGFAMLALAELLLVGLWLPLACAFITADGPSDWWYVDQPLLPDPVKAALIVAIPPTLAAIVYTLHSLKYPGRNAARRQVIVIGLVIFGGIALFARMGATARSMVVYSNFVPILLAGALVAVTALAALTVSTLVRGYRLRRAFARKDRTVGVVHADGNEPVIGIEIPSWLRGPRIVQRSFSIATAAGMIPVTGAELVAPLPDGSTLLTRSDSLGVLHPGQTVIIAGGGRDTGGPFRTSSALLSDSLYIAPAELERAGFSSAALALWRPSVAYLLIVTAVALPALVALLA